MSFQQLCAAEETEDSIIVRDVMLAGGKYTVIVMHQSVLENRFGDFRFATIDAQGRIV